MSSFNTLFTLTNEGELTINKLEAKKIPEFKVLFDRDLGSQGDSNGSKKYLACAELYYIYLLYDVRSIYYNLSLADRKVKAIKDAKLPNNWKEDKKLEEAVVTYKEMFALTAAGSAYVVAEKLYFSVTQDTRDLQEETINMKEMLRDVFKRLKSKTKPGDVELMGMLGDAQALIKSITLTQKDMIANVKTFDGLGNTVKLLATKFIEEGGNLKTPVGGGEINPREL